MIRSPDSLLETGNF